MSVDDLRKVDDLRDGIESLKKESASALSRSGKNFISVSDYIRLVVTVCLFFVYGLVLIGAMLIFYKSGQGCGQYQGCEWADASENALELIKIAVVPMIALVIGYYFGKSKE